MFCLSTEPDQAEFIKSDRPRDRAALAPKNSHVHNLNKDLRTQVYFQEPCYRLVHIVSDLDRVIHFPTEILHFQHSPGHLHELYLKSVCPVIILSILNTLSNKTRPGVK